MTLEQLLRALNIVAELKDDEFMRRAPTLYKYFADCCGGANTRKPQVYAEDVGAFIHQLLNYPEMAAEVMALAA